MEKDIKEDILDATKKYNANNYSWMSYDKEQDMKAIHNADIENALNDGIKQGIKQGIEQGIEQGIKQRNIEIAKEMLNNNIDIKTISKITKLSIDEINHL